MNQRKRAFLIGSAIGLVLIPVALSARSATPLRRSYELCASCGAYGVHVSLFGLPLGSELEESDDSRWMAGRAGDEHHHDWVFSHETWRGLTSAGIGCGRPAGAFQLMALSDARERLGEDPALVALVDEFLALEAGSPRRAEIADLALSLGTEVREE